MNNFSSLTLIFIFISFVSCSNGSIYSELIESFSIIFKEPRAVSKNSVDSIPYSSKQARIGRSQNSLIVLEEVKGDILKWTSSNYIKIYTKNDYVIRLTGLGNELDNLELDKSHPAITKDFTKVINKELTSFYTFNNPSLFRLPVKTKFLFIEEQEIEILGEIVKTKLYKEKTTKNLISWNFENFFWVNEDRDIVRSIQNFSPNNPQIYLLSTKKYKKLD